jgi:hypothetical protein
MWSQSDNSKIILARRLRNLSFDVV